MFGPAGSAYPALHHRGTKDTEDTEKSIDGGCVSLVLFLCDLCVLRASVVKNRELRGNN
jgi:hypothetical protein